MFITHQTGDIHLFERDLPGELQRHHDHPRHPEEDDVKTGYQHVSRVEFVEVFQIIRPAQSGERPQR